MFRNYMPDKPITNKTQRFSLIYHVNEDAKTFSYILSFADLNFNLLLFSIINKLYFFLIQIFQNKEPSSIWIECNQWVKEEDLKKSQFQVSFLVIILRNWISGRLNAL